jgi:hypothetical protein
VAIWYSLWQIGICFPRLGMLHQEKSGNPGNNYVADLEMKIFSPKKFLKPLYNPLPPPP